MAETVFIAGLFVLAARRWPRLLAPTHRAEAGPARFYRRTRGERWKRPSGRQAGMAPGSAAPTMISASRSARRNARKARSSSSRRASASWPASAWKMARAEQALDSVAEHLATPHGIVLQQPAFTRYYLHLGEISSYPPGYKENAGIFCHTNPWIMIAETHARARRPGARLLPAHQPLRARGDQRRAPLRAVCLRPDDRRARMHPRTARPRTPG